MVPDSSARETIAPSPVIPGVKKREPTADLGPLLEGVVASVSEDAVDLVLDDGRKAVITRANFGLHGESPKDVLSVGDKSFGVELHREDLHDRVVLSRAWALKKQAWDKILQKAEAKEEISGRVVSIKGKGLVVDVGLPGFLPVSHLELDPVEDLQSYKGRNLTVKILEADPKREKLVLSRKSLLMRTQRREVLDFLDTLQVGNIYSGKINKIAEYGVFVELGSGVSGLVHVSELSWEDRIKPNDLYTIGDEVSVKVLDVKKNKRRVALSIRETTPDPLAAAEVGSIAEGVISRLVDFGAFVQVGDLQGLVHISELTEYRISDPSEVVAPGDIVLVKVISVDKKRRRLDLSLRQAVEFSG